MHPCPSPSASFLFILGIRAAPAHMKSEVRAGLQDLSISSQYPCTAPEVTLSVKACGFVGL